MSRRLQLNHTTRRIAVLAVAAVVFLTVGVPRFLSTDVQPARSNADAAFTRLCRQHGGTPKITPGVAEAQRRSCTVTYGRRVYLMDAITPHGFDEDTAKYQRLGCETAQLQPEGPGGKSPTFVYHPDTGVCERRRRGRR